MIKKTNQLLGIVILSCFLSIISFAQAIYTKNPITGTIKGIVVDSASATFLSQVTVEVQEAEKNTVLKSTFTDANGFFAFTELSPRRHYNLTLTHTGYKTLILPVPSVTDFPIHLGAIALVSLAKQLNEIQVTSQRPVLEQSPDKLIYNVDADPESKTASAMDILRKIPLLSVDADENIQLNGNSNYRILINGKSSSLFSTNQSDMFRNLAASAIKTIEVITIPPSKYEAEGVGGIVNIITYKRSLAGYNGGINVRASDPKGISTNGNVTVKVGKFGFSGNFGHNNNTSPPSVNSLLRQDKIRGVRLEQTGNNSYSNWSQNGGGEISFELNEQNLVNIGYSAQRGSSQSDFIQDVSLLNTLGEPAEAYRRLNAGRNQQNGNDLNVDYQRSFKKDETRQLTFSYKRGKSTNNNDGHFTLQPLTSHKAASSLTENKDGFNEQTLKADYIQPLKKHTLELGVSVMQRQNSSDYYYKDLEPATGAFVLNPSQSNSFDLHEDIFAGYTSLNLKMGKWGLKTGARLEEAKIDAHFTSSGTATRQDYINLVPNVTLSRQLKGFGTLRLSYTQRVQRPDLYYLDPYVDRTDPWNISYGNPQLQPALAHVFNLAFHTMIKKTSVNLNIFHQFTNNSIQQFTVLDADTVARTTFGNIGRNQNTSFSLGFNTTLFKSLGISLNTNTNYLEYTSTINNKLQSHKGLTYNISGTANLRLNTWRIGSSIGYNAPNIQVQGRTASYTSNSVTLNKFFLKNNKANLGLAVNSPFLKNRRTLTEIDDPAFYQLRESLSSIRRFTVSLNYRFVKVQGSAGSKKE